MLYGVHRLSAPEPLDIDDARLVAHSDAAGIHEVLVFDILVAHFFEDLEDDVSHRCTTDMQMHSHRSHAGERDYELTCENDVTRVLMTIWPFASYTWDQTELHFE